MNIGYKSLIFDAFSPHLPEKIAESARVPDPLAAYNLAVDAKILSVTDQAFARAENLLSSGMPLFDPIQYGAQGKIMDSWETMRHNVNECDAMEFELKRASTVAYVTLSTIHHLGNNAAHAKVEGFSPDTLEWAVIVPKIALQGHSTKHVLSESGSTVFSRVRVCIYPDGGLTRLGLYNESLPAAEKAKFQHFAQATSVVCEECIATTIRTLNPMCLFSEAEIAKNWTQCVATLSELDVASAALGGKVVYASNEHFGSSVQVISPYAPIDMNDGFESARTRDPNFGTHCEQVVVKLARAVHVTRIEMDFSYFVNNNPVAMEILGYVADTGDSLGGDTAGKWVPLVARTRVKEFAGCAKEFVITQCEHLIERVRVVIFPDGGFNRVRVFAKF